MFNFNLFDDAISDGKLSHSAKLVYYLFLNDKKLKDGEVNIFYINLANKLKMTERQIRNCIKELKKNGYINVEHSVGRGKPNKVTIINSVTVVKIEDVIEAKKEYSYYYNRLPRQFQFLFDRINNTPDDKLRYKLVDEAIGFMLNYGIEEDVVEYFKTYYEAA